MKSKLADKGNYGDYKSQLESQQNNDLVHIDSSQFKHEVLTTRNDSQGQRLSYRSYVTGAIHAESAPGQSI